LGAVVQGIKQGFVADVDDEVAVGQDVFGGVFALGVKLRAGLAEQCPGIILSTVNVSMAKLFSRLDSIETIAASQ